MTTLICPTCPLARAASTSAHWQATMTLTTAMLRVPPHAVYLLGKHSQSQHRPRERRRRHPDASICWIRIQMIKGRLQTHTVDSRRPTTMQRCRATTISSRSALHPPGRRRPPRQNQGHPPPKQHQKLHQHLHQAAGLVLRSATPPRQPHVLAQLTHPSKSLHDRQRRSLGLHRRPRSATRTRDPTSCTTNHRNLTRNRRHQRRRQQSGNAEDHPRTKRRRATFSMICSLKSNCRQQRRRAPAVLPAAASSRKRSAPKRRTPSSGRVKWWKRCERNRARRP